MVLAILVFLLVAGAVAGGYVAVAHLPQILEGRRLEKERARVIFPLIIGLVVSTTERDPASRTFTDGLRRAQ